MVFITFVDLIQTVMCKFPVHLNIITETFALPRYTFETEIYVPASGVLFASIFRKTIGESNRFNSTADIVPSLPSG